VVSGLVFRDLGEDRFAMLALVRGTLGVLAYFSIGLAPALVRLLAEATFQKPQAVLPLAEVVPPAPGGILSYRTPDRPLPVSDVARVYSSGESLALMCGLAALIAGTVYSLTYNHVHTVPRKLIEDTSGLAFFFVLGTVFRLLSDAPSSLLQVRGFIGRDNALLALSELLWIGLTIPMLNLKLMGVGMAFAGANFFLLLARNLAARSEYRQLAPGKVAAQGSSIRKLMGFGGLLMLAQAADYLYAPVDYILINRLIDPVAVAAYAPAVQIDAGLHLLVLGLASVLLPRTAVAHASGNLDAVRRYYLRGTLASVAITLPAALLVWALSGWIFQLWLGDPMPATQAILPLVLLHNLIGGSGTVGRSVLLAMGRVKPYAASVLVAGVVNVVISYLLVRFTNLGLYGIVLGTICAVTGRALLWQPWYVMHAIRRAGAEQPLSPEVAESIAQVEMRDAP